MHKVNRTKIPASLQLNAKEWTSNLLSQIAACGGYDKVLDVYKNKYRQLDVQAALADMYSNRCCYCESLIGIQTFGRIEHLKPKSNPYFYQLSFDWNNLHWSCEVCNTRYKKTNWNFFYPILDPSKDDIDKYMKLNTMNGEYETDRGNQRAETTILHTGLNRDSLISARRRLIIKITRYYKEFKTLGKEAEYLNYLRTDMIIEEYPTVYQTVIDELSSL